MRPADPPSTLGANRDFRRLWTAQAVSEAGTQITLVAVPLIALRSLGASTFEVGLLLACAQIPFLLFGLPAGVWADRRARRPLLVGADIARALLLLSVPIAAAFDSLTLLQLFVVVFATGIGTVVFEVAHTSYLPSLVPTQQLVAGNARLASTYAVAEVGGPTVGGVIIAVVSAPAAFVVDAASFLASALLLRGIRATEVAEPPPADPPRLGRQILDGLRYVARHPQLRGLAGMIGVANLFAGVFVGLQIVFLNNTLGLSPGETGLVIGLGNLGGLVAAAFATRIARRFGMGRSMLGGLAVAVIGETIYLLAPTGTLAVPVATLGILISTAGPALVAILGAGLRQAVTENRYLGRMNASMRVLTFGTLPIGLAAGGAIGSAIGVRAGLAIGVAGLAAAVLPIVLTGIDRFEIPDEADAAVEGVARSEA